MLVNQIEITHQFTFAGFDARPALYDEQAARWEAFELGEEPESEHVVITTAQPLAASVEQVLAVL